MMKCKPKVMSRIPVIVNYKGKHYIVSVENQDAWINARHNNTDFSVFLEERCDRHPEMDCLGGGGR